MSVEERYTTDEMRELYSPTYRGTFFRKLWVVMAEVEKELGLSQITENILYELRENIFVTENDLKLIHDEELITKHDVMASINVFKKKLSPEAGKIIHLGCTSCFVQDNADMLIQLDALKNIKNKLIHLIQQIYSLTEKEKLTVCCGLTHYQPAQFVTIGKRFAMWNQDLVKHLQRLNRLIYTDLELLGAKGATGTQDSYLKLFDVEKVMEIDEMISKKLGHKVVQISGQTYSRSMDTMILDQLAEIACTMKRIATNIRLSQHDLEISEPFDDGQVGSSAMPYKQNPMRSERICSLAKIINANRMVENDSEQWFERTLDDSANKRIVMKQSLVLTDYIITLMCNVIDGIKINHPIILRNVMNYLPLIVTESIMMKMVKLGHDRQEVHEKIKKIAHTNTVYMVLSEIRDDPYFAQIAHSIEKLMDPNLYIGLCVQQVDKFHEYLREEGIVSYKCDLFDIRFKF
jgi:adenylosuccinate lyase